MSDVNNIKTVNQGSLEAPFSPLKAKKVDVQASSSSDSKQNVEATSAKASERQEVSAATAELPAKSKEITKEIAESAVTNINDAVQDLRRDIKFSVDKDSGYTVVKVTDSVTGEVVRQLPTEVALKLAERLNSKDDAELLKGNLFSAKA